MSDPNMNDEDPGGNSTIRQMREQIEHLTNQVDELKPLAERAPVLERENALFKANLGNLNEDQQAAVLATSKEMTADALRSQAERLGFVEAATPAVPPADLEAFDRTAAATAGGANPAERDWDAEIANASSMEELEALTMERGTHVNVARG